MSEAVNESFELRESLAALVRFVVPQLADVCFVDELTAAGKVERIEVLFADETKQRSLGQRLSQLATRAGRETPTTRVLASGEPLLFSDISDPLADGPSPDEEHAELLRAVGVRSMMTVPLSAHGKMLGALSLLANGSGRRYTAADVALVEQIGYRAAIALEHARLYEAAQRAVRGREDLLAIVSHDLKNPLAVIRLHLQMLLRARDAAEDRRASRKQLETMQRSAEQMHRLVNDLLTVASVEAGHLSVTRQPLDPAPLVVELLDTLKPLAESKSLRLVSEVPAGAPHVLADGARIEQVLGNLLTNATPDGGRITVRALPRRGEVVLSVTDTGNGIAAAELPRLFERFWQAKDTARLGSGLGLFIVKGIVDAHGGKVWVKSQPGAGTTVSFSLPRAGSGGATRDDAPEDPTPPSLGRRG